MLKLWIELDHLQLLCNYAHELIKGRKIVALEFTFDKENLKKKKNEINIDEELRMQS